MANPVFNSKNFQEQMNSGQQPGWYSGGQTLAEEPREYDRAPQGQAQYGQTQQDQVSAEQLDQMYRQPAAGPAQTGRMTINDVIAKTVITLGLVIIGAAIGWNMPALMLPGAIVGLVLGLVNSFKREPSPALILLYAAAEGLFLGGLSGVLDAMYPGIAVQAVLGTLCVFAATLALFTSGKVRATPKFMKIFMVAMVGYLVFSLVNLFLMLFNVTDGMFGLRSDYPMLGVGIGVLAVLLAAFSLVMDFTAVQQGVEAGAPEKYSWSAAFGLTVTLVWLYVEILRILAILRGND